MTRGRSQRPCIEGRDRCQQHARPSDRLDLRENPDPHGVATVSDGNHCSDCKAVEAQRCHHVRPIQIARIGPEIEGTRRSGGEADCKQDGEQMSARHAPDEKGNDEIELLFDCQRPCAGDGRGLGSLGRDEEPVLDERQQGPYRNLRAEVVARAEDPCEQIEAEDQDEIGRQDSKGPSRVEGGKIAAALPVITQNADDQESGQDEEQVDAGLAEDREPPYQVADRTLRGIDQHHRVPNSDQEDRAAAQSVEFGYSFLCVHACPRQHRRNLPRKNRVDQAE